MRGKWALLLAVSLIGIGLPQARGEEEDGPGRGVARLSVIQGDVSVRRGDSGDWVAGAVNAPLVVRDRVMTGAASRAEIQFDWANMVRLASDSEIRLAELEYRRYQVQLARGTAMLRVLRDTDAEIELNTPEVSVRPLRKGAFRVTVRGDESEITVRSGEAEIYTPTGSERLRPGRTMLLRAGGASPEFQTVAAIPRDRFDDWNESRDRYLERTRSYRYVSRDIYGADDLDYYGRWVWVPPYGWVWTPWGVAAWWAPYRYGRWVWVDWYGWTWLSYDPWGWAPFHYGRWFWHPPYGWCWYPGPRYHRHYWRPALVAFFGFHVGGVHVGFGFGRIGWIPLAPYEPYYPWYGHRYYYGYRHPTYIDNSVRIVNNVHIVNVYRNARVTNAISGVDADGFVRGGRVETLRVSDAEWQRVRLVQGPVPVVPAPESVRFADRPVRAAGGLVRTEPERFFSRRPAPAVERLSFDEQRRGMERLVQRAFGAPEGGVVTSIRAEEGARGGDPVRTVAPQPGASLPSAGTTPLPRRADEVRVWRVETGAATVGQIEGRGWRRLDEPTSATTPAIGGGARPGGNEMRGGWRTIGEPLRTEESNMPRIQGGERGGWQRFGVGGGADSRDAVDAGGIRRTLEERGGWRTIGEPVRTDQGNLPRIEGGERGRWQRFGAVAPAESREPVGAGGMRRATEERGGWRRFGEPLNRDRSPVRSDAEIGPAAGRLDRELGGFRSEGENAPIRRQADEGWRRFSAPRVERAPEFSTPEPSAPRWSGPSWRSEPRQAEPRRGEPRRSEPIFINPPIVRERSAPRWDAGPRWGGGEIRGADVPRGGEIRGGPIGGELRGGEIRGGGMTRSAEGRVGGGRSGRPR